MKGTIKVNNVLKPMMPYSCWSETPKERVSKTNVFHGNGCMTNVNWPHRMSTSCRYDNKAADERCAGCQVEYDSEYVDSLK